MEAHTFWLASQAGAVALAAAWVCGGVWAARRVRGPRRVAVLAVVGLLLGAVVVEAGRDVPGALGGSPPITSPVAIAEELQWVAATGLVAVCAGERRRPGAASIVGLAALAPQGGWAMATGTILAAVGAFEQGGGARRALVLGLGGFTAAHAATVFSLDLWSSTQRLLGLGADPASLLVEVLAPLCAGVGWCGLLAWAARPRTRLTGPRGAPPWRRDPRRGSPDRSSATQR